MSWETIKLGDLLTESKIESTKPNPDKRIRVRLNVLGVEKRPLEIDKVGATKYYIRKSGQFIYGKQNLHKGAFGIVPSELNGFESSSDIPAFDISKNCMPEWIHFFFKQDDFYKQLDKFARGVGSKRIHPEQIYEINIPLPDIEVQKTILSRFKVKETLFSQLQTEIEYQHLLLKQLRLQILQNAIQGKLVSQDPNDEPAIDLIERIKAEKRNRSILGRTRKQITTTSIKSEEMPFKLPKGWAWYRLGELLKNIKYGTSKKCSYNSKLNTPILRIPNISIGEIDPIDLKYADLDETEKKELSLSKNDILIVRSNGSKELVGRTAIVSLEYEGYCYAGYLVRLSFFDSFLDVEYIHKVFQSVFIREQIEKPLRTTVGIRNINSAEISNLIFPIPPLEEQRRIVKKINGVNELCKKLKLKINETQVYEEILNSMILKEAFESKQLYKKFLPEYQIAAEPKSKYKSVNVKL